MTAKAQYLAFDSFVFRTPLFPYQGGGNRLRYLGSPVFDEALFLASPELHGEMRTNGSGMDGKVNQSVYKYYSRSFSRCTPFGLFAGCSVGKIGTDTAIELEPVDRYRRCTRLDMNYVCALIQHLEQQPEIRGQLRFYPNDSIYEFGGKVRYVEYYYQDARRIHQLNCVEQSDYLQRVLDTAREGATVGVMAGSIIEDEITFEDAEGFVFEMIDSQLLKSELDAQVTGDNPLDLLIGHLEKLRGVGLLPCLKSIRELLVRIDSALPGSAMDLYAEIIGLIDQIGVKYEPKFLFQTDMFKPVVRASISNQVLPEINRLIEFLNRLTPRRRENNLSQFRDMFYERYEDLEVPLTQALDKELGLGYPVETQNTGDVNELIDDLVQPGDSLPPLHPVGRMEQVMMEKYVAAVKNGEDTIVVTDKDFESEEAFWDDLPATLSLMCRVKQGEAAGSGQFLVRSVGGASAGFLLGRFCHLDESIHTLVREVAEKEQAGQPDVLFAEIAHLPESRIGNIASRPVLRDYEIHYLSKSGVSPAGRIPVSDLMLSVRSGRIVMRSKRHGKEVIPRLTNAHNYSANAMPIYNFLCDMQTQDLRGGVYFRGTGIFDALKMKYIPRVCYRNFVLSRQKWLVDKSEIKGFDKYDDKQLIAEAGALRQRRGIPACVVVPEGDNELYVDLTDLLSIRTMISMVRHRPEFQLEEFWEDDSPSVVKSAEGGFVNECIFLFYKNSDN